jgi:hypothetical protein
LGYTGAAFGRQTKTITSAWRGMRPRDAIKRSQDRLERQELGYAADEVDALSPHHTLNGAAGDGLRPALC